MPFTFTVTRDNTTEITNPLTVNLSVGGTATFGVDYTVSGATSFTTTAASLIIPANSTSATIVATQMPDAIVEPDETIILTIVPTSGVLIVGVNSVATATIINDDSSSGSDPLFADVLLLLPLTTSAGLTDIKGKSVTNAGSALSTAVNDPFGNNTGVRIFAGGGAKIIVAQSADFALGSGAFTIDGWLYPTLIPAVNWGIADTRLAPNTALDWAISGNPSGQISLYDTSTPFYEFNPPGLILNQWNYFCFARPTGSSITTKLWINGVLATTNATRNNSITAGGNLLIGDTIDAISASHSSFTGYASNIRITRAYRDGSIVPTVPFPTN